MPARKLTQRLGDIVAQHEVFFVDLAARHPVPVMRSFLRTVWHPFFAQWSDLTRHHGLSDTDVDVLRDVARDLSAIRIRARERRIPVPALAPDAKAPLRSEGFFSDLWDDIVDTADVAGSGLEEVWDVVTFSQGEIMSGHHGHHGGGHRGGGRRRFGGGGWYGPAYGYYDWPYYDGDTFIDADEVTVVSGRHARVAELSAHNGVVRALAPLFVSGFFDSVKDAVLTYTGTKATNQFIKDNHLEPYVQMGAKAISTYYGGPAAGKASDYITPMMMSVGVNDDKAKDAQTQAQIAQASQAAAQHSPQANWAMKIAQDAAQKTATAYHVAQIAKDAKAGHPAAQQAIGNLDSAAKGGDTNAAAALLLAQLLHTAQERGDKGTARDPNWQVDASAIEMDSPTSSATGTSSMSAADAAAMVEGEVDLIGAASSYAATVSGLRKYAANTIAALRDGCTIHGAIQNTDGTWQFPCFDDLDTADDWMGGFTNAAPGSFAYVAYFDASDPLWPLPLNDALGVAPRVAKPGKGRAVQRDIAIAAGVLPWALGAAAAATGMYLGYGRWQNRKFWRRHPVDTRRTRPVDVVAPVQTNAPQK